MTATRDVDTISTAPGGKSGAEWTEDVSDTLGALWKLNGGILSYVSGTNAITASIRIKDGFTSYGDGLFVAFEAAAKNTGAMSLNISNLGEKSLVDAEGNAFVEGDIAAGQMVWAVFDAGNDVFRANIVSAGAKGLTAAGLLKKRSPPFRLAAEVSATTATTIVGTIAFACDSSDSRVFVEGCVLRNNCRQRHCQRRGHHDRALCGWFRRRGVHRYLPAVEHLVDALLLRLRARRHRSAHLFGARDV